MSLPALFDILAFLLWLAVAFVIVFTPVPSAGPLTSTAKGFMLIAVGIYLFGTLSDVVDRLFGIILLNDFEDYLELLFVPLAVYAITLMYERQKLTDSSRAESAVRAARDLMVDIIDTAPAGIMVLDDAGRITFANPVARDVLDLVEEEGTGDIVTPGWVVHDQRFYRGEPAKDLHVLVGDSDSMVPLRFVWPSAWRVELDVHTSALHDSQGRVGGTVAAFERPGSVSGS